MDGGDEEGEGDGQTDGRGYEEDDERRSDGWTGVEEKAKALLPWPIVCAASPTATCVQFTA